MTDISFEVEIRTARERAAAFKSSIDKARRQEKESNLLLAAVDLERERSLINNTQEVGENQEMDNRSSNINMDNDCNHNNYTSTTSTTTASPQLSKKNKEGNKRETALLEQVDLLEKQSKLTQKELIVANTELRVYIAKNSSIESKFSSKSREYEEAAAKVEALSNRQ